MTKVEEFKDYFDEVGSMPNAKVKWNKNIVTVTLEIKGLRLSKMFNAETANFLPISGDRYADMLFKDMLIELIRNWLHIYGVDF